MKHYDVAVVGAGIAGAGLAAEIAPHASVLILEAEAQPGYHATGRSAAFWSETYGGPNIQPLVTASGDFLHHPPERMGSQSFLSPRGELFIARREDRHVLDGFVAAFAEAGVVLDDVDPAQYCPGIRPEWTEALYDVSCCDIDVAALHGAYLAAARRDGAELVCDAAVTALSRDGAWRIETRAGTFAADVVVNAAGAWAEPVGLLAGAPPTGIAPLRRTMVQLRVDPPAPMSLPLVRDAHERFYFKPESGGRIWLSPHDEIPTDPCDAAPEEIDVAIAIDKLASAVDWHVEALERRWAGLRTFAPDRKPVYGFDPAVPGLFWCAGQGGFGIQTAPAASKLAAAMLLGSAPDPMVAHLDPERYSIRRFRG
ncbi:FAD-binding oxidoreductase [Sphingomonas sp.]|uniref:NAD(P)/FAD-dependent oxidoreductase n=1 Tax=Sphingomonas sp. TaxID=28214 RepID=UPI0017D7AF26|nr:FAD-binding oxidoreductase [Sphingomonas sp.]MBA4762387.1 FAD-binding oxidoreductase [Sphingomonas sp.]